MTIEEMRERKRELGDSIDDLVRMAGVPKGTVQKVMSGRTKNPISISDGLCKLCFSKVKG